jgi:hypothetical protein
VYLNQCHELLKNFPPDPSKRVRIAILDTGLNKHHPKVDELLKKPKRELRIKTTKCKSWVDGLWDEDSDGHGTACAMIAHQVAPNADIYIARIFEDRTKVNGDYVVDVSQTCFHIW